MEILLSSPDPINKIMEDISYANNEIFVPAYKIFFIFYLELLNYNWDLAKPLI
jgi:hypothetical protein